MMSYFTVLKKPKIRHFFYSTKFSTNLFNFAKKNRVKSPYHCTVLFTQSFVLNLKNNPDLSVTATASKAFALFFQIFLIFFKLICC